MTPKYGKFELGKVKVVDKPWGRELLLAHTDKYAGKILEINKGAQFSLQYHEVKKESFYILSGKTIITNGEEETVMQEGDCLALEPGQVHRMRALEDTRIIEISTPELEDVVRIKDDYGREGTSEP